MKITVIGGSQGTGASFASLAQQAGHQVTVLSRSGSHPEGTAVLIGDATDEKVVRAAVANADAVIVTVGGTKGHPLARTEVTRSTITAMQAAGAKRLLVQSSLGAGDSGAQLPGFIGSVTKLVLAKPLADHNQQEALVQQSQLDWTIVRPTGLTNADPTGSWAALTVGEEGKLKGSIPRRDLATFMLQAVTDDSTSGKAIGVSSA